jgi:hypothetical protein
VALRQAGNHTKTKKNRWQNEARFSFGKIHQVANVGQLHLGTNYHFAFNKKRNKNNSFYTGAYLKYWDYYNRLTEVHFYNIAPYIAAGRQWHLKQVTIDARINQTISIISWSGMEGTKPGSAWFLSPWPEFISVLPTFTLTVSYKI